MKNKTNLINEIVLSAKNKGISQLVAEDEAYNGRTITVKGKEVLNFGSYSYLGLETDPRLKKAAAVAVLKYGIQYPSSRAYVSSKLYSELEELISSMYNNAPIVLATSLSIGHHGVMPIVVQEGDAIILDQQVHSSVQDAARKVQMNGIALTIVRHNNMEELKSKIEELSVKHERVWYMCDGVYSMYGDVSPVKELAEMTKTYRKLHLYIDDAHGMSAFGKNGTGYVTTQIELNEKMILCTGMAKGFGTIGAIYVIPDQKLALKVRNCAGPLIFSGQQATCVLSASIASARIHLSEEITRRQNALAERIEYCHKMLRKYKLPDVSDPSTPIFFIGVGMMSVGFNLVKRMLDDGFYMNIAAFPAVPETCTGIRFTITHHITNEDIDRLVPVLAKNFYLALEEEKRTVADIKRAFRKITPLDYLEDQHLPENKTNNSSYILQHETSIQNINPDLWNSLLGERGGFDYQGLKILEETFCRNIKEENKWQFHYYIIKDQTEKPLLATFFTIALTKDDMLAPVAVSEQIEQQRNKDPYYLTSRTMMMGTLVTEGDHLYIDRSHPDWQQILMMMLDKVMEEFDRQGAEALLLRDFCDNDTELSDFLIKNGFIRTSVPDSHILSELQWESKDIYLNNFQKHRRQYLKQKVFKFEMFFNTTIKSGAEADADTYYSLYENVRRKSLEVNTFSLPREFFSEIMKNPAWEVIEMNLCPEYDLRKDSAPVAVMFCYKTATRYCPMFVGLDYQFSDYNVYPQILWKTILRARELNVQKINFGFTASQNKQKFGAVPIQQSAFIQMKDHYKLTLIGMMPNNAA